MTPIPHDKELAVVLVAEEWNVVLSLITEAQAPYRLTAPIIAKLQQQLTGQANAEGADVSRQD